MNFSANASALFDDLNLTTSRERNLSNQQTFLVTITRLRDGLTLFVNNASRLEAAVERNPGTKQSALETIGALRESSKREEVVSERKEPERERAIVKPREIGI